MPAGPLLTLIPSRLSGCCNRPVRWLLSEGCMSDGFSYLFFLPPYVHLPVWADDGVSAFSLPVVRGAGSSGAASCLSEGFPVMTELYSYTCEVCGLSSRPTRSRADMRGQKETHDRVAHGHVTRNGSVRAARRERGGS